MRPSDGCCVTPASICTVRFLLLCSTVSPRVGSSFPSEQRGKEGGREPKKKEYIYSNHLARSKNALEDFVYLFFIPVHGILSDFLKFLQTFSVNQLFSVCFEIILFTNLRKIPLSSCELTNFSVGKIVLKI